MWEKYKSELGWCMSLIASIYFIVGATEPIIKLLNADEFKKFIIYLVLSMFFFCLTVIMYIEARKKEKQKNKEDRQIVETALKNEIESIKSNVLETDNLVKQIIVRSMMHELC